MGIPTEPRLHLAHCAPPQRLPLYLVSQPTTSFFLFEPGLANCQRYISLKSRSYYVVSQVGLFIFVCTACIFVEVRVLGALAAIIFFIISWLPFSLSVTLDVWGCTKVLINFKKSGVLKRS